MDKHFLDGYDAISTGHLLKDGSAGVSQIEVPHYNGGMVDLRTRTLQLDGGNGTSNGAFIIKPGAVLEIGTSCTVPDGAALARGVRPTEAPHGRGR